MNHRTVSILAIFCALSLFNVEVKSAVTVNWKNFSRWDSSGNDVAAWVCLSPDKDGICHKNEEVPVGESRTFYEPVTVFKQIMDTVNEHIPLAPKPQITFVFRKIPVIKEVAILPTLSLTKRKRVVLVDLEYPYGKKKIYMSGSLMSVAAQCHAAGHQVDVIDFNIDDRHDERVKNLLSRADVIGVSVVGSPYFPSTIAFCQYSAENYPNATVILGGQVLRGLDNGEFRRIFGKRAVQGTSPGTVEPVLSKLPSVFEVSFFPVWEQMGDTRLRQYLEHEFALVLSQGCIYNCHFCFADKNRHEEHKRLDLFTQDLQFLMGKAKQFGIPRLECYASALDFFQNPQTVVKYMQAAADAADTTGVKLQIRALSCMSTFLKASRTIPNFSELVNRSGLWCVGFGIDGPNKEVWKQQNKLQNNAKDIVDCLDLSETMGLRAEVLMIMGYPNNTPHQLWATVRDCYRYTKRWPNTVLRPYLAKTAVPGNLGWDIQPANTEKLTANPQQFYNLDICALGSPLTHPRRLQRWLANLSYLSVIVGLAPFGRCATSPLLPQGSNGPVGLLAKLTNRFMPFDR